MSIHKSYAVFGLGRYGSAVAKELIASGAEVLCVDVDNKKVEDLISEFPICKCADITDPEVLDRLGISNIDTVIIAMAGGLEASVMATMLCKEAGVKEVIVKCGCEMHRAILKKVGADQVILPENESGIRLAKNLLSSGFIDIADLSDDITIAEINVKKEWIGKSLSQLDLRKKYSVNVIAYVKSEMVEILNDPSLVLEKDMKLIVVANKNNIYKLKA